jgi:hypothetical protein
MQCASHEVMIFASPSTHAFGSRNSKSEGGATFCQTTLSLVGVPPGSWADLPGEASLLMGTVTNIGMML